ncbi:hypothetical protein [Maribacter ulvicola]|uniref:Uncharacterized protein n=1 Tax=Maribacter ulvicola TaxID=228959 RepID=A0A1N6PS99_9FLAO|nr:hypothetical protein [Maribacter ulvicola]SIQ07225.1 hypothetical protein SAMN05421797_101576 [Maribacter ulvicola]
MREGLIKDTYELIIKEIQTVITASYIIAVGIGMLFNYQKYSEFDINIFNYSDVFDFLIAPFSDFYILFFATASILFVSILIKLDTLWKNKWPKSYAKANFVPDNKSWYKTYRIVLFIISFFLYLYLSADYYGKYTKNKISNQNNISIKLADNEIKSGKLIGKTKDVLFLLNNGNVYAIPITSLVKEIKIK